MGAVCSRDLDGRRKSGYDEIFVHTAAGQAPGHEGDLARLGMAPSGQRPSGTPSSQSARALQGQERLGSRDGRPRWRERSPGAAPQPGEEVVVRQEIGGGYGLQVGDTGTVLHVDVDGDVLVAFAEHGEQWVHSSMLPKLERSAGSVPTYVQVLFVLQGVCSSMCGWSVLVGLTDTVHWQCVDHGGPSPLLLALVLASALSFAATDFGLAPLLARHCDSLAVLPPLGFAAAGLGGAVLRGALLVAAATAVGMSGIATLSLAPGARRREVAGWGLLLATIAMPSLRWASGSVDPFVSSPAAEVALGVVGALNSAVLPCIAGDGPESDTADCLTGYCRRARCGVWLGAVSTGSMGGAVWVLSRAYLASLRQPALSAYGEAPDSLGLAVLGSLVVGVLALAAMWCMTPWWLDTCQAALVIGVLPLAACSLQGTSEIALARWGSVQGSGTMAFSGLMLLTLIFPFMLALLGRELCLLSQSGGLGRAFAVAACSVVGCFVVAHAAADVDGTALATDDTLALFRHRQWMYSVLLGCMWCAGVWAAPGGSNRPSVHDLWYLSRHVAPSSRKFVSGACICLSVLVVFFVFVGIPMRSTTSLPRAPLGNSDILVVAGFDAHLGFDMRGWSNVECASRQLASAHVDLVGLANAYAAYSVHGSADPDLAYATRLRMDHFRGVPSSLPMAGQAVLSGLRIDREASGVEMLPGDTSAASVWLKIRCSWKGAPMQFHTLRFGHLEVEQVAFVAQRLREVRGDEPLVLVASVVQGGRPSDDRKVLAELVNGTGLREAWGLEVLAPAEYRDFVFFRGLELVGKLVLDDASCSDRMLTVASFHASQDHS